MEQMDVKLSDCVPNRLRRKAASGAIAFEPRLERNRPFANVRRSMRRNRGWVAASLLLTFHWFYRHV